MPDLSITVCGREFTISCGEGEEQHLQAAAALLDAEACALVKQDGRLTELRMLLLAGLVLADRSAGLQRDLRIERERVRELEKLSVSPRDMRMPEPAAPEAVVESLSEIAAQAESLANIAEEKASS